MAVMYNRPDGSPVAVGRPVITDYKKTIWWRRDIDREGSAGHWIWTGKSPTTPKAAPMVTWRKRRRSVRNVLWEIVYGEPVPEGNLVMAVCAEERCVRPDHAELATRTEYMTEIQKARWKEIKSAMADLAAFEYGSDLSYAEQVDAIARANPEAEIRRAIEFREEMGEWPPTMLPEFLKPAEVAWRERRVAE